MKRILKLALPRTGIIGLLKYVCLGILSGLCSFLFINTVTRVVTLIIAGEYTVSKEYMILFTCIILAFMWVRRTLSLAIIHLSQTLFWSLRKEILSLVLKADYQQLAGRRTDVHAAVVSDVNILTNASMGIIDFFTAAILAVSCLVYLATISMLLFGITLVIALLGITVYRLRARANVRNFQQARALETSFQENFNAILNGFKEIYMEPEKGRYIFNEKIGKIATEAFRNNTKAYTGFLNNQITGQVLFYILISSILLVFSVTLNIPSGNTVSFVFTLLYLLGAIETIMVLLPNLVRARVASNHLMDLKTKLEETDYHTHSLNGNPFTGGFEQIVIRGLEFHYIAKEEKAFSVGPVNFDIAKGEIVFIYGGNGSGKTTFMHTVLGLHIPTAGQIWLNGVKVTEDNYADYRAMFAVVFSDFYLFNDIAGVQEVDLAQWNYYLQLFELEGKVTLEGRTYSTTSLSTGQRKRLALITALMEGKPVLVIDEWAADQDPHFRRKFYTEIIPMLKQEGITILAITHDDKYYHCADKLYKMDYGKLMVENVSIYQ
ncbi:cyclic peptide export ABC transporter [Chitinophaga sp. Cy-1792]|uniref:cyclic peptide export ABC transporter n=1 Tax=Chitinophaga sp. Cy-1792 TaxID=2608339 RepID=UPI001422E051|nr:cyclic peptide export ABC transporter [Chitinophaga sp. Cy-1792]NIG56802.1 cyclic peptide export ABC transporter [Chitinophaga sp. Cy-1792]